MANPLMLEVIVDDKGNPVLKDMQTNIKGIGKAANKSGGFLKKVFLSGIMLQGMMQFKQAFAGATREVMEFNKVFKQVEGITRTSGVALDILKKKTIAVSNATEHTAVALGKVALQVSKMGFTLEESLMVIPHMANLSTAAVADLTSVTQIAVQTMKSFQMPASEMEHIVNVIQGTVSQTALDFEDFAEAMKFVAPIAKTMNITLEETAAMIGILGDVGIKGSLGGTTLKNMFLNIMRPSENVRKVLEKMNFQGKNFVEILKNMKEAGIPVREFLETFNRRAVAGSLALADLYKKVNILRESLEQDKIVVAEVAATIREAWIPQLKILRNVFVNTFVVMGEILSETDLGLSIAGITQRIMDLQTWLIEHPEELENFAKDVAFAAQKVAEFITLDFETFIKNLGSVARILKIIIGLKIAAMLGAWVMGLKATTVAFYEAATAAKTFGAAIPVVGQFTVALWVALEVSNLIHDSIKRSREEMQKLTYATDINALKVKLNAAKDMDVILEQRIVLEEKLAKLLAGTDDQFYRRKQQIGQVIKQLENFDEQLDKDIELLSKRYGLEITFFTAMKKEIGVFIEDLETQIWEAESKISGLSEKIINKIKGLKIPEPKDRDKIKKGAKTDVEVYWEAYVKYFELIAKGKSEAVARVLAGFHTDFNRLLKAGETVGGLTGKQIKGLGALTPGFETQIAGMPTRGTLAGADIPVLTKEQELVIQIAAKETQITKTREEQLKIINKLIAQTEKEIETIEEIEEAERERLIRVAEEHKAYMQEQFDVISEAALMHTDIMQMIDDAFFEKKQRLIEKEMKLVDEKYKREIKNVEGNYYKQKIIDAKYARDKKKLIEEQEALLRKQKEREKIWSLIEIAINTAVGISAALRVAPPAGYVLAAITAAMGITQAAIVASQEPYYHGGYTGYGNPYDIAGYVHKKEYVVKHQDVEAIGGAGEVERMIDERLEGVGEGGGRPVYVIVENFIGTEEYERELFTRLQKESQRW